MQPGILVSSVDLRPSLMSILKGLDEACLLKQVVTTVAIDADKIFGRCIRAICSILPSNWRRGVERRFLPDFLKGKVQALYSGEIARLLAKGLGNETFAHRVWLWAELGFDRRVAGRYSGLYRCIYGMEHSSQETFQKQKKMGGLCILRQVMAHGRRTVEVMKREIHKFPEYAGAYGGYFAKDIQRALARKELEYELADMIVVNSRFVKETFIQQGIAPEKIVVVPTGCPSCSHTPANAGGGNRPLIFLFVGRLSLRKGLTYLIKAWQLLKPGRAAELWLVGTRELPNILKNQEGIRYFKALSPANLARIYRQADVFILPTLLEGLAYVLLEALSFGLPIITTQESGGADFVQNGRNGLIVESTNADALLVAMAWCLEHREKLQEMGRVSLQQAGAWNVQDSNRAHLVAVQHFLKEKGF